MSTENKALRTDKESITLCLQGRLPFQEVPASVLLLSLKCSELGGLSFSSHWPKEDNPTALALRASANYVWSRCWEINHHIRYEILNSYCHGNGSTLAGQSFGSRDSHLLAMLGLGEDSIARLGEYDSSKIEGGRRWRVWVLSTEREIHVWPQRPANLPKLKKKKGKN